MIDYVTPHEKPSGLNEHASNEYILTDLFITIFS